MRRAQVVKGRALQGRDCEHRLLLQRKLLKHNFATVQKNLSKVYVHMQSNASIMYPSAFDAF